MPQVIRLRNHTMKWFYTNRNFLSFADLHISIFFVAKLQHFFSK